MKTITVQELKALKDKNADFQLIDVREEHEYEAANLGGILIPLATILQNADKIAKDKQVIVHCRSGKRSAAAILQFEKLGLTNLFNLEGGILAYAQEIDESLDVS